MLYGFNLSDLLIFPFRDSESRKYFLIGCLIYLVAFVIPILPWLVASGYSAALIRQVLNGEQPHLVPWDNWEAMLKDGARLVGIRLLYSSPLLLLFVPLVLFSFSLMLYPAFAQHGDSQSLGAAYLIFMLVMTGLSVLIMPLSLAIGLLVPAAEIHVIAKDDFSAGLQFREWWPIFKKNWGGFVVALGIFYAVMLVAGMAMQFLFLTIVLICLLPFFIPAMSMYFTIIQYVAFTQAYKDGQDRLSIEAAAT